MEVELSPEESSELEHIVAIVLADVEKDLREMAGAIVTKKNDKLLGESEFEVRRITHRLGARVVEAAVEARKKGGTKGRA
jgi:hypothetical protein